MIVTSRVRTGTRKPLHRNRQNANCNREHSTSLRGRCRGSGRSCRLLPLLLLLPQMRRRIQASAAALRPAETRSLILAIVQVIVISQFFPGLDVAQRDDPHLAADLICFAVRPARMIHERRYPAAIDDDLSPVKPEQV